MLACYLAVLSVEQDSDAAGFLEGGSAIHTEKGFPQSSVCFKVCETVADGHAYHGMCATDSTTIRQGISG